jgi:nucleoside-diphosphate-sugar epimerase
MPRLREKGYPTVGLIRRPEGIGADKLVTDWMNAAATKDALAHADIIIHLSGDANAKNKAAYRDANYNTTKLVADHLAGDKPQRIIYLSYANAGVDERNLYLKYKGEAEQLLLATGKEVVIFRCPVIVDAPGAASRMDDLLLAKKGRAVPVIGDGRQRMHPVYRGDVVEAILAAMEKGRAGVYELSGPEELSVDELIRLVNRNPGVRMRHIPRWIALVLSRVIPGLSPVFVDLLLRHSDSAYTAETYREFGIEATPVSSMWNRRGADGGLLF